MLFGAYLKHFNCTVDEAENGAIAVSKYIKHNYDIILMDVQMPEMDGYSATRAIREHEKENNLGHIPIVALTAHAQKSDAEASLQAGCTRHVVKPVTKKVLLEAIAELTKTGASENATTTRVNVDRDIESLIPTFLDNRATDIVKLKTAITDQDTAAIKKLGHILKGIGGGYGFDFITDIGRDIENAGRQGDIVKTEKLTVQMEEMLKNLEIIFTD
jgi:CheY-like chemotaxis protein